MSILWSLFFGAGIAAVAYAQLGKRVGYGDSQSVWTITGTVFVFTSLVFFITGKYVIHIF